MKYLCLCIYLSFILVLLEGRAKGGMEIKYKYMSKEKQVLKVMLLQNITTVPEVVVVLVFLA